MGAKTNIHLYAGIQSDEAEHGFRLVTYVCQCGRRRLFLSGLHTSVLTPDTAVRS